MKIALTKQTFAREPIGSMYQVLVICGPTATGKTALAEEIAQIYSGQCIVSDSRHIYQGLPILTGKDISFSTPVQEKVIQLSEENESRTIVPYQDRNTLWWLYNLVPLTESISASVYGRIARNVLTHLHAQDVTPIMVGGSGHYITATLDSFATETIPPNRQVREQWQDASLLALQQELQRLAPSVWVALNASDKANPRRLLRKIEIIVSGGNPLGRSSTTNAYNVLYIGLFCPDDLLRQRISRRVDARLEAGVIEEVKALREEGIDPTAPGLAAIGWKEVSAMLDHQVSLPQAREVWITREYQYAKRQLTYFRRDARIHWIDITSSSWQSQADGIVASWVQRAKN